MIKDNYCGEKLRIKKQDLKVYSISLMYKKQTDAKTLYTHILKHILFFWVCSIKV